jgi:hypothetical protein
MDCKGGAVMVQTINGHNKYLTPESMSAQVGIFRRARSVYNFTVDTGAQGAYTIFTVTGNVVVTLAGVCLVALTSGGAATIEVGIAGNTAGLIAQTTATDLDQYEVWRNATPEASGSTANITGAVRQSLVANGTDIIFTVGTADLTAGEIHFNAFWMPLSTDGNVVAT